VHIENRVITKYRLFVKEDDGSINEVPESKIKLRPEEVVGLQKDIEEGRAHVYGVGQAEVDHIIGEASARVGKGRIEEEKNEEGDFEFERRGSEEDL